jgi:molybdopterin molybdotransferase
MGAEPEMELDAGEAVRIATGGMLPLGADAVLMLEHAQVVDERMVEVQRAVSPGENVIRRGEDIGRGEGVLREGHRVRPQDVAVLAALGANSVKVFQRPMVAVISTGDEIVAPDADFRPGRVRDSNSYHLAALLEEAGCVALRRGIFRDEFNLIRDELRRSAEQCAMVLISGGSSVGARDVTERVLADTGRVLFHCVAMKPGKPLLAGFVNSVPVFGLPGHPRAVAACFEVFVRPFVHALSGRVIDRSAPPERVVWARLARSVHSSPGRRDVISVMLEAGEGELRAVPLLGKSGLISTMIRAHGVFSIPLERVGIEKDEVVEVQLF